MEKVSACAKCSIKSQEKACRAKEGLAPDFCPTRYNKKLVEQALIKYQEPDIREFARVASLQEAEGWGERDKIPFVRRPVKPRMEEISDFSRKMGFKKLGLAYCAGLQSEGAKFQRFLENQGFQVVSVACKVGCIPKEEIGITDAEKVEINQFESMCNPITQAEILNDAGTDFNVVLGLCVGHDSLFFKHSKALTTVFAAKDRVLGHNPLAALYTLGSYYDRLNKEKP